MEPETILQQISTSLSTSPVTRKTERYESFGFLNNPDGSIRWLQPWKNRHPLFFHFYHIGSWKLAIKVLVAKVLYQMGWKARVYHGQVSMDVTDLEALKEKYRKLGVNEYALFTGTPGHDRKATAVLCADGTPVLFAKFALTAHSAESIAHEVSVCRAVQALRLPGVVIPEVVEAQENMAVFKALPKSRHRGWNYLYDCFLGEWAGRTWHQEKPNATATFEAVFSRLSVLKEHPAAAVAKALLAFNAVWKLFSEHAVYADAHGDFTPWNTTSDEDTLRIWDWEASNRYPLGFDLIHYHWQEGVLVKKWNTARIVKDLEQRFFHVYGSHFRIPVRDFYQYLGAYLLYQAQRYLPAYAHSENPHVQTGWLMQSWKDGALLALSMLEERSHKKQFRQQLFADLAATPYAVLRSSAVDFDLWDSGDLDIAMPFATARQWVAHIRKMASVQKCEAFAYPHGYKVRIVFTNGNLDFLDLVDNLSFAGLQAAVYAPVLEQASSRNGVKVLDPATDLAFNWLFYGINGAALPGKYLVHQEPATLNAAAQFLKTSIGLTEPIDWRHPELQRNTVVNILLQKKENSTLQRYSRKVKHGIALLRQSLSQPGMVITFTGPDGSGKTTMMDFAVEQISKKYRRRVILRRHRPSLLPLLSQLLGKKQEDAAIHTPHAGTNKSVLGSYLRFAWYFLDYTIGQWYLYFRYVLPGSIVVYDRYYYDLIVDPRRTNLALSGALPRMLQWCIKRPDLNVLLLGDPETIYARKPELPVAEIRRMNAAYKALFERYDPGRFIILYNDVLEETQSQLITLLKSRLL
jgi:thymidylate kinase